MSRKMDRRVLGTVASGPPFRTTTRSSAVGGLLLSPPGVRVTQTMLRRVSAIHEVAKNHRAAAASMGRVIGQQDQGTIWGIICETWHGSMIYESQ